MNPWDEPPRGEDFELRDYVDIVRRAKTLIVVCTVVAVLAALMFCLVGRDHYRAEARVALRRVTTPFKSVNGADDDFTRGVLTEVASFDGATIRNAVRDRIGSAPDVSVRAVGQSDVIAITATSRDPARAARVANAYADAYIAIREREGGLQAASLRRGLLDLISARSARLDDLNARVASAPASTRDDVADDVKAERDSLAAQIREYQQRVDELDLDTKLSGPATELIERATPPSHPDRPPLLPITGGAAVAGLLAGVVIASLRDWRDRSVKTVAQVRRAGAGSAVLGPFPVTRSRDADRLTLVAPSTADLDGDQPFDRLRVAVDRLRPGRPVHVVLVAGSADGDGSALTTGGLSVAYARAGYDVIVVDADLRPAADRVFAASRDEGVSTVLSGQDRIEDCLVPVPGLMNLRLLPVGVASPAARSRISGRAGEGLVRALRSSAEIVIVHGSPLLRGPVSVALAGSCDVSLVTTLLRHTRGDDLHEALERLRQTAVHAHTVVLQEAHRATSMPPLVVDGEHVPELAPPPSSASSEREPEPIRETTA